MDNNKITQGTPSKDRIEKIDNIIRLDVFKRDSIIYTAFEELAKSNKNVAYLFCEECRIRNDLKFSEVKNTSSSYKDGIKIEHKLNTNLENIDKELYKYYNSLYSRAMGSEHYQVKGYTSEIVADAYILIKALGKKRFNEIHFYGTKCTKDEKIRVEGNGRPIKLNELILELLTDDDMLKIEKYMNENHHGTKTIIKRNYKRYNHFDRPTKNNNVYVELDLTKPLAELTSFIQTLRDDFLKTDKIKTINYLVGNKDDMFVAELHKHDVYKQVNRAKKSNTALLGDVLFIYDCIKADLDEGSIVALLDNHYDPVKINTTSLRSYYELVYDFIDNERYKDFISGYSSS